MRMIRKWSVVLAAMMTVNMLCGCERTQKKNQQAIQEAVDETKGIEGSIETDRGDTKNEIGDKKEVSFADKWERASRFIQQVLDWTPGVYEKISKEEVGALFEDLTHDLENGLEDETTVYYRLCHILASMKHVHMGLYYTKENEYSTRKWMNLGFVWTKEGLVLFSGEKAYKDDLGSIVTKINGYSIDEVMNRYATIQCQETDAGKKNCFNNLCSSDLQYLGIMKPNEQCVTLSLKNEKGEEKELTYDFSKVADGKWQYLIEKEQLPFTYQLRYAKEYKNYSYEACPDNGIMYFQYLTCSEQEGMPFSKFFDEMIQKMQAQDEKYKTLVIDVRWNGGGNRSIFQNELFKHKDYLKNKSIAIITGDLTASAGVQLIEDCLVSLNNVTLYGGPTCGAVHNYTEIKEIQVPGTDLILIVPSVLDDLPALTKKYGDVAESVLPDVPCEVSLQDIKRGVDTIFQRIVDETKKK